MIQSRATIKQVETDTVGLGGTFHLKFHLMVQTLPNYSYIKRGTLKNAFLY